MVDHVGTLHGDTKRHVEDSENDGELHLDGVGESKHVELGNAPCWIEAERIRACFWVSLVHVPRLLLVQSHSCVQLHWVVDIVARAPEIDLNGEEIVVNHTSVSGHEAHEGEQVPLRAYCFADLALFESVVVEDQEETEHRQDGAVAHVAEHHSEEEGECRNGQHRRVGLLVLRNTVSVHDHLESCGRFIRLDVRRSWDVMVVISNHSNSRENGNLVHHFTLLFSR